MVLQLISHEQANIVQFWWMNFPGAGSCNLGTLMLHVDENCGIRAGYKPNIDMIKYQYSLDLTSFCNLPSSAGEPYIFLKFCGILVGRNCLPIVSRNILDK